MRVEDDKILFSNDAIARRIEVLADGIALAPQKPEIAVPILVGAYIFAADLLRALALRKLTLPIEFVRLCSYDEAGPRGEVKTLIGPSEAVKGKHVLLIDGVLDSGATLAKARELLFGAGASSIKAAVVVAKNHPNRLIEADHVGFEAGPEFLYGYGMDRSGKGRGLPDIRIARGKY